VALKLAEPVLGIDLAINRFYSYHFVHIQFHQPSTKLTAGILFICAAKVLPSYVHSKNPITAFHLDEK
jgi:hypothetical protein